MSNELHAVVPAGTNTAGGIVNGAVSEWNTGARRRPSHRWRVVETLRMDCVVARVVRARRRADKETGSLKRDPFANTAAKQSAERTARRIQIR